MVAPRIVILLCCAWALGACVETSATAPPDARVAPVAVSNGALPPNPEPGQLLRPGLGAGSGVDPTAQLAASARDRAAWAPLRAGQIDRPAIVNSRNAESGDRTGPSGMASAPSSGTGDGRGGASPVRGQDAPMNRLEREGQRTAKPICTDC